MPATNSLHTCCSCCDTKHEGCLMVSKKNPLSLSQSPCATTAAIDATPLPADSPVDDVVVATSVPSFSSSPLRLPLLQASVSLSHLRDALSEVLSEAELLRLCCHPVCHRHCLFANALLADDDRCNSVSRETDHTTVRSQSRDSDGDEQGAEVLPVVVLPGRHFHALVRRVVDEHCALCGGDLSTACEWVTMEVLKSEVETAMDKIDERRKALCRRLQVEVRKPLCWEDHDDSATEDNNHGDSLGGALVAVDEENIARSHIAAVCRELTGIYEIAIDFMKGHEELATRVQQLGDRLPNVLQDMCSSATCTTRN